MSRKHILLSFGIVLLISGCHKPQEPIEPERARPLPKDVLALRRLMDPADYPDFSPGFHHQAQLRDATRNSLGYLAKPSSQPHFPYGDVTHARAVASLERFLVVLDKAKTAIDLDRMIRNDFEVYESIGSGRGGGVVFTGQYTPLIDARKQPSEQFPYPLYRLPPDLTKDEQGHTLGRKQPDGTYAPYETRRQIEEGNPLKGLEIAWLADPFEAYVVTIQGSAMLRLEDGSMLELGYAGNNGHDYTSVAELLIADGCIERSELSLQAMFQFFKAHPQLVHPYCRQNDRYVFLKETQGGPYGSIGVPMTPMCSIATDKEVFPRACLAFIQTQFPAEDGDQIHIRPYSGFALDQDTGSAIRGAARGDVYVGVGDRAEALAGRVNAEGKLYYLFVKPQLMPKTSAPTRRRSDS